MSVQVLVWFRLCSQSGSASLPGRHPRAAQTPTQSSSPPFRTTRQVFSPFSQFIPMPVDQMLDYTKVLVLLNYKSSWR